MGRYALVTSVDEKTTTPPGMCFIGDGARYLIQQADPDALFTPLDFFAPDPAAWDLAIRSCDAVVIAGGVRYLQSEMLHYCESGLWREVDRAANAGLKILDLSPGAACGLPLPDKIESMSKSLLLGTKNRATLAMSARCALVTPRDVVTQELVSSVCANTHLMPCVSWWARRRWHVEPRTRRYHAVVARRIDYPWLPQALLRIQSELNRERETLFLCAASELDWFEQACGRIPNVRVLYDPESALRCFAEIDKMVSLRVHGSIPSLSLGVRVANLFNDSRAMALEEFGIESQSFTTLADESFTPDFASAELPSGAEEEYVRLIQDALGIERLDTAGN